MSWLTVAWSGCAAACGVLGILHAALWFMHRRQWATLLFSLTCFAAAASSVGELLMMRAATLAEFRATIRWHNVSIAVLLVGLVAFLRTYTGVGRPWLARTIAILWGVALVVNFTAVHSLVFAEVRELAPHATPWGETFVVAVGETNPLKAIADFASLLILLYVADASLQLARRGNHRQARTLGVGVLLFMVAAGIHTPLVDAGIVETPYMISFAFLAILIAMSYELLREVVRASRLAVELRAEKERWWALLERIRLAVIGIDAAGRIDFVNPAVESLTSRTSAELVGCRREELLMPETRVGSAAGVGSGILLESSGSFRAELQTPSGGRRTCEWRTLPLRDPDGTLAGGILIGTDLTEQLEAQRDLRHARRDLEHAVRTNLVGELIAEFAHETGQPLAAILSNAQAAARILKSERPDLDELREIVGDIIRDDRRANAVIDRLRSLVRHTQPSSEVLSINDAVREVVDLAGRELESRGISLELELSPESPRVEAGWVEIQQVVLNLVLNAMEALSDAPPDRRVIEVATAVDSDSVRVLVRDSGPGIPQEMLPGVFEPFRTSRAAGMGMGLAICRRLVEAHSGTIAAENHPRGGAVFTFRLPLAVPAAVSAHG